VGWNKHVKGNNDGTLSVYLSYLKLAKTLHLSYYFLWFLFNKTREQEDRIGSTWKWGWAWGGSPKKTKTKIRRLSKK
jgi:hypothetical protein